LTNQIAYQFMATGGDYTNLTRMEQTHEESKVYVPPKLGESAPSHPAALESGFETGAAGPQIHMSDEGGYEVEGKVPTTCTYCMMGPAVVIPYICVFPGVCMALSSCFCLREKNAAVLLRCGKYEGQIRNAGCYCIDPCCTEKKVTTLAQQSVHLPNIKVADKNGNPLIMAGIVNYRVVDPKKALLKIENYNAQVINTAQTVMKEVSSTMPYESYSGDEHALKDSSEVSKLLKDNLQRKLNEIDSGIRINVFAITDISYSPEISKAMLVKQQATALISARRKIVEGAVDIATDAITQMEQQGVSFSKPGKDRLVSNLLTVICGDEQVRPVISI